MKRLLFAALLAASTSSAMAQICEHAGQSYSLGSSICECPSLKATMLGSTGAQGQITSRRMTCSKDNGWVDTTTLCVDASGHQAQDEYPKYVAMFCPRVTITPQETERYFNAAPKSSALAAVQAICNRFKVGAACKAALDAIAAAP